MLLFGFGKKKEPAPAPKSLPLDFKVPKKDIKFIQIFPQSESSDGFCRARVSPGSSDLVERNTDYFRKRGFEGSSIQLMTVRSDMDPGIHLRVIVDGRYLGNIYNGKFNAEPFAALTSRKVDRVHMEVVDTAVDGKYYGSECFAMVHWPDM